jgi:hypothetical protein
MAIAGENNLEKLLELAAGVGIDGAVSSFSCVLS